MVGQPAQLGRLFYSHYVLTLLQWSVLSSSVFPLPWFFRILLWRCASLSLTAENECVAIKKCDPRGVWGPLLKLSMVGVRRKRDGEPCACTKAVWGPVHGAQSCWASLSFFHCGLEFVVGGPNDALSLFGWSDQDEGLKKIGLHLFMHRTTILRWGPCLSLLWTVGRYASL
ncbi:hypothetical protein TorRG33x02_273930 [Trema orientale]|uniref:Uncharacterized protein n=1 Tax=Trema orientale TaxID=63057 RepID=A0A2P5CSN5_TREOI|nr:hypothetical protein TorRG33x02_273930 [Trema orientale]